MACDRVTDEPRARTWQGKGAHTYYYLITQSE